MTSPSDLLRIARQQVETVRLLGVDAVPVRPAATAGTVVETPAPAPAREPAPDPAPTAAPEAPAGSEAPVIEIARSDGDPAVRLAALAGRYVEEVASKVTETPFTHPVFGEGNPRADLVFVGEGPGTDEDRTGRPFVGKAGQKLNEMIRALGLRREDVYIANVVKIRPPGNRTPLPDEIDRDAPFLREQLSIIRPRVIVALGAPAMRFLLQTSEGITRLRGQWGAWTHGELEIPVMPTFHPAYVLRNYTRETREKVWMDLQKAMTRIRDETS